jgi:hypothetical protein
LQIIQIIGRATRDSDNKTHAQFTNLIAQPDAEDLEVKLSVNNMLKAITASLLMEQVLAPNFKFKPRFENDIEPNQKGELKIRGFKKEEFVKETISKISFVKNGITIASAAMAKAARNIISAAMGNFITC